MTRGYLLDRLSKRIALVLGMAMVASGQSMAQLATAVSDTELSKDIENPVTRRITLPLRYEADFLNGAGPTRRPKIRSRSTRRWCRSD